MSGLSNNLPACPVIEAVSGGGGSSGGGGGCGCSSDSGGGIGPNSGGVGGGGQFGTCVNGGLGPLPDASQVVLYIVGSAAVSGDKCTTAG